MKNKGLLTGALIASIGIFALASMVITNKYPINGKKASALYSADQLAKKFAAVENEKNEQAYIKDAMAYINRMRASNPATGELDPQYVYQARQQMMAQRQNGHSRSGLLNWEELGPDNVGGRTRAILVDQNNSNRVYAGSVTGGLFYSDDAGLSWKKHPINDVAGVHSISSIVQASNGDIYYGTGESFVYTQQNTNGHLGGGIYKSSDNGQTFSLLTSTDSANNLANNRWSYVNTLAVYPNSTTQVYAATETGLYITQDGGATWAPVQGIATIDQNKRCTDVKVGTDGTVHAAINRKYYRADAGTNGLTFTQANVTGFPIVQTSFVTLAVAPQDPNYVYTATVNLNSGLSGVYRSTDGGFTWAAYSPINSSAFNPLGNQGDYDIILAVSPANKDRVYLGGQLSMAAGGNDVGWATIAYWIPNTPANSYYIHADMHAIAFDPKNPDVMYVGSDGGINKSLNASANQPIFTTRNKGYNVTQFYHMDASLEGEVMAGAQDNGTNYIDYRGNTQLSSAEVSGGDGGFVAISKYNPNALYAETPNGALTRSADKGNNFSPFFDTYVTNSIGFNEFICPMLLWEGSDTNNLFLYGATNNLIFTKQALDFSGQPVWYNIPVSGNVTCIAKTDVGDFYVGTDQGGVYRIKGLTTTAVYSPSNNKVTGYTSTLIKSFANRYVGGIDVDHGDPSNNTIVVTLTNYGNSNYVYKSTNAYTGSTATFTDITNNLPHMPVYGVVIDHYNSQNIILATDLGIWASQDGGATWSEENAGLSSIPIYAITQQPLYNSDCQVVYAASYGRGMFRTTSLISANRPSCNLRTGISEPGQPLTTKEMTLYPNPTSDKTILDIDLQNPSNVIVRIVDMIGRVYEEKNYGQLQGKNSITLDVSHLTMGNYLVTVQTGNKNTTRPLVVVK